MQHPERLGKYNITSLLGEGAMGVVYKGYDPGIGRHVAIKTIRKSMGGDSAIDESLVDRFKNEARAVGRMNHPGIVAIYDLGEDQERDYIPMEFVEGRDLSQILAATPCLSEPVVLRLMHQLLDALEYAHQHGVWHRDIKPANLIITAAGQLKVTDFGIARIESAALTQVKSTIGTPGYMAPEQYIGESFDHRVDLFATGVLLYRMLTGKAPFSGSMEVVMYNIMNNDPPPLHTLTDQDVAAFYSPIVAQALAKKADNRFANAAEFRSALQRRTNIVAASAEETTVLVQAVRGGGERALTKQAISSASSGSTGSMGSGSVSTDLTQWDAAVLAPLQTAMTHFMGPMAKILVRQAAKKCNELPALIALLVQDIPNADDQTRFLAMLQRDAAPGTHGSYTPTRLTSVGLSPPAPAVALSPAVVERAHIVMVKQMGPIAKIIVKKAAAKATSAAHFVELLAQELPDGPQRHLLTQEFLPDLTGSGTQR